MFGELMTKKKLWICIAATAVLLPTIASAIVAIRTVTRLHAKGELSGDTFQAVWPTLFLDQGDHHDFRPCWVVKYRSSIANHYHYVTFVGHYIGSLGRAREDISIMELEKRTRRILSEQTN